MDWIAVRGSLFAARGSMLLCTVRWVCCRSHNAHTQVRGAQSVGVSCAVTGKRRRMALCLCECYPVVMQEAHTFCEGSCRRA